MKLLILTQKVDESDDVLGFFHEWIRRFAMKCDVVEVICLYEGVHSLPSNVHVHSLGKEKGFGRLRRIICFYTYLWKLRYNAVFVHMNPEYVALGGWWWRLNGKRTVLWYAHRSVDLKLRIASVFANVIATTALTSFRLPTSKLRVVGHGIDTNYFKPTERLHADSNSLRLISVGRITPIKGLVTAIEAISLLKNRGIDAVLKLVGAPGNDADRVYENQLNRRIVDLGIDDRVVFAGPISYPHISEQYAEADLALNLAPAGGLDKTVLEAMASGVPALVSNEGFSDILDSHKEQLLFAQGNATDLSNKIVALYRNSGIASIRAWARKRIIETANLDMLITKIIGFLYE